MPQIVSAQVPLDQQPAPVVAPASNSQYPAPEPPETPAMIGSNIQRTMTLLATSTPQRRNTIKVLFYGQSITEQKWSQQVADDLRRRFPHANLIIENRAIGGFASQLLIKPAEHDLYPFYPDLVIFYVYGSHVDYESIIKNIRQRTTAEILIQNEHVTRDEDLNEETDPAKVQHKNWSAWMSYNFHPSLVQKYGVELVDQRSAWKKYMQLNKLSAKDMLIDGVHLNDRGNFLMAELVKPYLRYNPALPKDAWQNLTRDYVVGKDIHWDHGRLKLEFEGNRVDVIPAAPNQSTLASAQVLIDDKKPSQFPELFAITRPSKTPNVGWPTITRVDHGKPLVEEEWMAKLTDINEDASRFKFTVTGSVTGPDGEGTSDQKFISKSGRVAIEPESWYLHRDWQHSKKGTPNGFEVKWRVVPLHQDVYATPANLDPTIDNAVTLAQGLSNSKHTLELVAGNVAPQIQAIRVYTPWLK
jgi:hypothetical protein